MREQDVLDGERPPAVVGGSGLMWPLLRMMVAAAVASCSGLVPYISMWRRAIRANSSAV